METPNVILLTLDTLRADRLGCYGYDIDITPNIDRLAASGVRFDQAITGGSWTQAAFPTILTSTYASMYGGCLGPLSWDRPSPVTSLAKHGYRTGAFVSSPLLGRTYGYDRGFEHFIDMTPEESHPLLYRIKGGQRFLRQPWTHSLSALVGKQFRPAPLYVSAEELNNHFYQWLHEKPLPFFAWIHYMDIHWPYHREDTLSTPDEIAQVWEDLGHMHRVNWNGAKISPAQYDRYLHLYEEAVRYTDLQVGQLVEHLEQSGQLANTVIILVSDHGEEFLERSRWGHFESNLYDEILKVPLVFHMPGMAGGQIVTKQVRTLDIMPTVLDICGCSKPPSLEGASLTPLWTNASEDYDVELSISEMWRDIRHIVAVRSEKFKYIWDSRYPEQSELYDLLTDPQEEENLNGKHQAISERFQAQVEKHIQRAAAQVTSGSNSMEPDLDDETVRRLRDLGYLE